MELTKDEDKVFVVICFGKGDAISLSCLRNMQVKTQPKGEERAVYNSKLTTAGNTIGDDEN